MGHPHTTVIDCKHFSKNLDVTHVEGFISFLDDVGVDLGMLVTQTGFSKAAKAMAATSRVKLEVRKLEELRKFKIEFDFCEVCEGDEDHMPPIIEWGSCLEVVTIGPKAPLIGECSWCNSLNIRCPECGEITGISEEQYGDLVECAAECGISYQTTYEHVEKGIYQLEIRTL
jgi:Restriction endonuclease